MNWTWTGHSTHGNPVVQVRVAREPENFFNTGSCQLITYETYYVFRLYGCLIGRHHFHLLADQIIISIQYSMTVFVHEHQHAFHHTVIDSPVQNKFLYSMYLCLLDFPQNIPR